MGGDSGGRAGRMGPVGMKRKCTEREEDVMGRRKKGLGVTTREEGSDVDVKEEFESYSCQCEGFEIRY